MRYLRQIWDDITQGENIDLYFAFPLAIGLAILNIVGVVPSQLIEPITLLVLGTITVSLLVNRNAVKKLSREIHKSTDDVFRRDFPPDFESDVEMAKAVFLIGVTLTDFVRRNYFTLQKKMGSGHSVKVMIVDPDSKAIELAEERNIRPTDIDQARSEAKATIKQLCHLREEASKLGGKLEVRTIQHPLSYAAFGVNLGNSSGTIYISHFAFKMEPGSEPKMVLRVKDGHWFDFYKNEIFNMWESGVEWEYETN